MCAAIKFATVKFNVYCVGVINEDEATVELASVTTEITVDDITV